VVEDDECGGIASAASDTDTDGDLNHEPKGRKWGKEVWKVIGKNWPKAKA
jgi:hypothetical protein